MVWTLPYVCSPSTLGQKATKRLSLDWEPSSCLAVSFTLGKTYTIPASLFLLTSTDAHFLFNTCGLLFHWFDHIEILQSKPFNSTSATGDVEYNLLHGKLWGHRQASLDWLWLWRGSTWLAMAERDKNYDSLLLFTYVFHQVEASCLLWPFPE